MRPCSFGRAIAAVLASLVLVAGLGPSSAAADKGGWGYSIAHELMSPFCPGRTLAACTSPQAGELRQWILLQEAAGATREEVEGLLYQRYGEVISSSPAAEGWGLAAYLLPIMACILGGGCVYLVLRRMVAPGGTSSQAEVAEIAAEPSRSDGELERMVDEELRASDA